MSELWTSDELVAATDGRPLGHLPAGISGISIDSRSLKTGEAFFAIKGDAMDLAATAAAGVGRISWGPRPWKWAMDKLTEDAKAVYTKL